MQRNFLPNPAAVGAGAAIHKEEVLHRVIGDEEIQPAVIVIIEPNGAGAPAGCGYPGFLGYVLERPVVVIFVENAFPICSNENVWPAVVVVVAHGGSHPEIRAGYAGFLGDVGKRPIPIVLIQRIADWL